MKPMHIFSTAVLTVGLACGAMLVLLESGCTLKGTTDEISDTTSNVTVSTSGRTWFTEDGILHPEHKLTAFTVLNQANLEQDLARGEGEYTTSLVTLLGLSNDQHAAFITRAQGDFETLIASDYEVRLQHLQMLTR
jgi:hypothetical protein